MYNKNIYLATFASLHPRQLFSSSKHSSFQAGQGKCMLLVSWVLSESWDQHSRAHPLLTRQQGVKHSRCLGSKVREVVQGKTNWGVLFDLGRKNKSALIWKPLSGQALKDPRRVKICFSYYTSLKAGSRKGNLLKLFLLALWVYNSPGKFWLSGKGFIAPGGKTSEKWKIGCIHVRWAHHFHDIVNTWFPRVMVTFLTNLDRCLCECKWQWKQPRRRKTLWKCDIRSSQE